MYKNNPHQEKTNTIHYVKTREGEVGNFPVYEIECISEAFLRLTILFK